MQATGANGPGTRTVALAGATGLVGREILAGLLADNTVAKVHTYPGIADPKLTSHVVGFGALLSFRPSTRFIWHSVPR